MRNCRSTHLHLRQSPRQTGPKQPQRAPDFRQEQKLPKAIRLHPIESVDGQIAGGTPLPVPQILQEGVEKGDGHAEDGERDVEEDALEAVLGRGSLGFGGVDFVLEGGREGGEGGGEVVEFFFV